MLITSFVTEIEKNWASQGVLSDDIISEVYPMKMCLGPDDWKLDQYPSIREEDMTPPPELEMPELPTFDDPMWGGPLEIERVPTPIDSDDEDEQPDLSFGF